MDNSKLKDLILEFEEFCKVYEADSFRSGGFSRTDKYVGTDKPGSSVTAQARTHDVPNSYKDKVTPYIQKGKVVGSRLSSHGDPIESAEAQDMKEQITKLYLRIGNYTNTLTDKQENALKYTQHKVMIPLGIKHILAATLRAIFGKAGGTLGPRNPQSQSADKFIYSNDVNNIVNSLGIKSNKDQKQKLISEYAKLSDVDVFKNILSDYVNIVLTNTHIKGENLIKLMGPIIDYVWARIEVGYNLKKEQGQRLPELSTFKNTAKKFLTSPANANSAVKMMSLVNPDPDGTQKGLIDYLRTESVNIGKNELLQAAEPKNAYDKKYDETAAEHTLMQSKEDKIKQDNTKKYYGKQVQLKDDLSSFVTWLAGKDDKPDIDTMFAKFVNRFPDVNDAIKKGGDAARKYMVPDIARYLDKAVEAKNKVLRSKEGANHISTYDSILTSLMLKIYDIVYKK